LSSILTDELSRAGLEAMGFDEDHVIQRLREFCIYVFGNYAVSCRKPRWADKSTTHVDHADFIARLFPEAQFIMMYRHGLDQAHSFTRGGHVLEEPVRPYYRDGEDPRLAAVRYWRAKNEALLRFEEQYPDRCCQALYESLCESPEQELRRIFEFLGEPWEPRVLQFHRVQHDKGPEHGRTVVTRGFSVSRDHYATWPPLLVEQCRAVGEPVLRALGYAT
jgi:hypothetical protein